MAEDKDIKQIEGFNPDAFLNDYEEEKEFDPDKFLADDFDLEERPSLSAAEAFGLGVTDPVGLADELSGAVQAGLEAAYPISRFIPILGGGEPLPKKSPTQVSKELKDAGVSGDIGPENLLKLYQEARDKRRALQKQAEEEQPGATLAGQLATGLLVPAGGALKTGATLGKQALQGAKVGSLIGAATGAGRSESEVLEGEIVPAVKDVATDAAVGAGLGAALPIAIAGGKTLVDKIGDFKTIQQVADTFKRSKAGEKFAGQIKNISEEINDFASSFTGKIRKLDRATGEKRQKLLDELSEQGKTADISKQLQNAKKQILELPEDTADEIQDKNKLLALIDRKLEGVEQVQRVQKEVTIPGQQQRKALESMERQRAATKVKTGLDEEISPIEVLKDPETGVNVGAFKNLESGKISARGLPEDVNKIKTVTEKQIIPGTPVTEMTPSELSKFTQDIGRFTPMGVDRLKTSPAAKEALSLKEAGQEVLESITPGYKKLTQDISDIKSVSEGLLKLDPGQTLKKGDVQEHLTRFGQIVKRLPEDEDIQVVTDKFLKGYEHPQTGKRVQGLEELDPEIAKFFKENLNELSARYGISEAIDKMVESTISLKALLGTAKGLTLRGTEALGSAIGSTQRATQAAQNYLGQGSAKIIDQLSKQDPGTFANYVNSIRQRGGEQFANILEQTVNAPGQKRTAVMYSLMQNPAFRKLVGASESENEENNETTFTKNLQ